MSDVITVNVTPDPNVNILVSEGGERVVLNPVITRLIDHASTHYSGARDELDHNSLGSLQGGQSGEFYHLKFEEYNNLTTGSVVRPDQTGAFYPTSNPSGFITGVDLSNYYSTSEIDSKLSNTGQWDEAYSWGDHALEGYVTGSVVRPDQTGAFYPTSNPSGFISTGNADLRFVNVTGDETISGEKTFTNNTFFQSGLGVTGLIDFNLNQQAQPLEGQVGWHPDYGTVQIGMNGGDVINPVGFKNFYRVKAQSTIRKGAVVMAAGSVGNSEYILAREAANIGSSGELIMGISSEKILGNNFGDVVAFGPVRGVDTSSFPEQSILYYDPQSTGGLTNQIPAAPNAKVIVAFVTSQNNNGIVFTRVSAGSKFGGTDSNVVFDNLSNNQSIFYNESSGIWYNKQISTGDVSGLYSFVTGTQGDFVTQAEADVRYVDVFSNQNISGQKTFNERMLVNGSGVLLVGEAEPLPTTIVYQTGDQTISGAKTFADSVLIGPPNVIVSSLAPEVDAIVSQMSVTPTDDRIALIDVVTRQLISTGLWSLMDTLYFFAAHDQQAALVDWKVPTRNAQLVLTPQYTADRGINCTNGYINTNFVIATDRNAFSITHSMGFYSRTSTRFQNSADVSIRTNGAGFHHFFNVNQRTTNNDDSNNRAWGDMRVTVNAETNATDGGNSNSSGLWVIGKGSRGGATNVVQSTRNGAFVSSRTIFGAYTEANLNAATPPTLVGVVQDSSGAPLVTMPKEYAFFFAGGPMNATQHTTFYSIILGYMRAVGANV
jgi:hypothetical protein